MEASTGIEPVSTDLQSAGTPLKFLRFLFDECTGRIGNTSRKLEMITHEQALADWKYLWSIAPAYDMANGYVESKDLEFLLSRPTETLARNLLCSQIEYWFEVGPNTGGDRRIPWSQPRIQEIAKRHGIGECTGRIGNIPRKLERSNDG